MIKIFCDISQRLFKDLFSVLEIFVCIFVILPVLLSYEINNMTITEANINYIEYNVTYENITKFNSNVTDFDNQMSDVATELESIINVTEDSDSSFESENNEKSFIFHTPDENICNCDLTSNACDINCCCDPDCTEKDMQVFSECSHQILTPDENYCYQKDIIYRNNTVYKMVKNPSSSMFCIVHDNFKHRLRFKDMPIFKSHRDLTTVLKYKYSTIYSWDAESEIKFESNELRAGNHIYIHVKSNKKVTFIWSLPSSCLSDVCSCKESVHYMRDFHSSCTHLIPDLRNQCEPGDPLLSGDHVSGFCIGIRHPEDESGDRSAETSSGSNAMLCADRSVRRPRKGPDGCHDVVSDVHFVVRQEGAVITAVDVLFRYVNLSFDRSSFVQGYDVVFVWSRNASSDGGRRSGNPGYRVGLPVLASGNASSDLPGTSRGLDVLERDGDGSCSPAAVRRTIRFGKNLRTGCVLRLRQKHASCEAVRNAVSVVLLGSDPAVFVGTFGNANASDPSDWTEVFHDDPTDGGGDGHCRVSLGLRVDVVYAAVGTVADPQHKILGVECRRTSPQTVDVACGGRSPQECAGELRLSTSVSFFDVTLPALENRAKVPSVKANLPADFFYPFVFGTTSGLRASALLLWWCIFCHLKCFLSQTSELQW